MRKQLYNFLAEKFPIFHERVVLAVLADAVIEFIDSPEFSALYAQRTHPSPDPGLGHILNLWRISMSQATDQMAAAITNLQKQISAGGGVSAAQVTSQITAAVTPLTTQIQTILASEGDDASKIADIQKELAEFTTAFAPPASSGSGASSASGSSSGSGKA